MLRRAFPMTSLLGLLLIFVSGSALAQYQTQGNGAPSLSLRPLQRQGGVLSRVFAEARGEIKIPTQSQKTRQDGAPDRNFLEVATRPQGHHGPGLSPARGLDLRQLSRPARPRLDLRNRLCPTREVDKKS